VFLYVKQEIGQASRHPGPYPYGGHYARHHRYQPIIRFDYCSVLSFTMAQLLLEKITRTVEMKRPHGMICLQYINPRQKLKQTPNVSNLSALNADTAISCRLSLISG